LKEKISITPQKFAKSAKKEQIKIPKVKSQIPNADVINNCTSGWMHDLKFKSLKLFRGPSINKATPLIVMSFMNVPLWDFQSGFRSLAERSYQFTYDLINTFAVWLCEYICMTFHG